MQSIVLGTKASQEPLESFFQRLGDETVNIIGPDGHLRAKVIPAASNKPAPTSESDHSNTMDRRLEVDITKDLDELKRLASEPRSTTTTEELLRALNSLPLPK